MAQFERRLGRLGSRGLGSRGEGVPEGDRSLEEGAVAWGAPKPPVPGPFRAQVDSWRLEED